MSSSKDEELVLVVKRALFDELGAFEGVSFDTARYVEAFLRPENNSFLKRGIAEYDPSFKQLIPYTLLVCGETVLHYTRGGGGGEARLHAKGSIGIGGHINPTDLAEDGHMTRKAYLTGMQREMTEELEIGAPFTNHMVALLNDDSNDVGKVHLGIIHVLRLEEPLVNAREDDIVEPVFLSVAELKARHDRLETWSQRCVEYLEQILTADVIA
jgi:predicted NUDIX family phosphoesterase